MSYIDRKHKVKEVYNFICLLILFLSISSITFSQSSNFNSSNNWKFHKKEVYIGIGATQFLGDVGGGTTDGMQKTLADINIQATRIGGCIGYRYRFHRNFATKTHINIGLVSGSDAYSSNEFRYNRNLHFRSIIAEVSQQFEWILIANERMGHRYKIPGVKGMPHKSFQFYLFAGVGAFYYNPQAWYVYGWENLRPLGTEGQNFSDGPKKYDYYSYSIPMGFGMKFAIGRVWKIGIEFSYHYTFTDYIDDVSGGYYDKSKLAEQSQIAADLSNRSRTGKYFPDYGHVRGSPDNTDAYIFANISIIRNLTFQGHTRKSRVKWKLSKSRY